MDQDVNALRAEWEQPIHIRFGAGRTAELPALCRAQAMRRPLLVTDPGVAGLSILREAVASCAGQGIPVAVFSDTRSNPTLAHAEAGFAAFMAGGHDGLIAFGGGTAIETAKVIGLLATGIADPWSSEFGREQQSPDSTSGAPPIIAVPTTAGSGAEVRSIAMITDPAERRRRVLDHPAMLPGAAILDPVLTINLPPALTAATGMNALAHNLEAFCAPGFDPMAESNAAEGIRLVRANLPTAVREGHNLSARAHMLAAAMLGGTAFRRGLGAIQALTDPIAATTRIHHGLATAVLTPYVLIHNRPVIADRIGRLAAYLGLDHPDFDSFLHCLLSLRLELGIPHSLRALGFDGDRLRAMVDMALADPFRGTNPRPLEREDIAGIYDRALTGDVGGQG
ncbi:iron-containing alcohol dehydrogenase [Oleisolibacter albus]|uniref:iron-containing alcohol dehydrogenase n=1 Tax=Oleisolibacter albus TaxID=2171757 RepID=UPI00138FB79B|nr:iron-containing alcohol dehydrogenase [Oleisolibacter albus]